MKFKMNLGFKIAILVFFAFIIILELTIQYFQQRSIEEFKFFKQSNLVQTAKLISSNIDGNEHNIAISTSDSADYYYKKIQSYLERERNSINFTEQIFTVFLHNDSTSCFGVKTNSGNIARNACEFRSPVLYPIFKKAFKENKALFTDIYSDRNGVWISAFAPILDINKSVVSVLELDLSINEYRKKLAEFTNWANNFRFFGVIISLLIGLLLGYFFGKPVRDISTAMTEVSNNSFKRKIEIPMLNKIFPDEVAVLVNNFNNMANKLDIALSELQDTNKKLNDLNKSKTIFLNLIAHELKTPITGLGFIDYLQKHTNCGSDEEEIFSSLRESYERIKRFSLSAEKYISALNYELIPNFKYIANLNDTLQEAINQTSLEYANMKITIHSTIEKTNNLTCSMDEQILYDNFKIILDNAFKFSKNNSIIQISSNISNNSAIVIIRDYGVGIEPINLDKIFVPFFVNDILHHTEGNGVNLPICKTLFKKFGGDIEVYSEGIDKGAIFSIIIPI
ncbi:MAG: HAMP domain-containing sensor histidine kinase [Candidatus Kapaibacteriota bacterium]